MSEDEINALWAGLTSFYAAARPPAPPTSWEEFADLSERHGLAALLGYQLEYRWPGRLGAPEAIRERLLTSYQGALGDNVYKLVLLKQLLAEKGAPEAILLGAASVADTLYPHVAFRPVPNLELLVRREDFPLAIEAFAVRSFRPRATGEDGTSLLSDGRIDLVLRPELASAPGSAGTVGLFERKVRALPYGPRAFRLGPEDALLALAADLARDGLWLPRVRILDLREMALRGARADEGFWDPEGGAPLDRDRLLARAGDRGLRRTLHCALSLVAALFPEAAAAARILSPPLPARTRALLERLLVIPAQDPRRRREPPGAGPLRRALLR